jgi:hypothetical protein
MFGRSFDPQSTNVGAATWLRRGRRSRLASSRSANDEGVLAAAAEVLRGRFRILRSPARVHPDGRPHEQWRGSDLRHHPLQHQPRRRVSEAAGEHEACHSGRVLEARKQSHHGPDGDADHVGLPGAVADRGVHGLDGSIEGERGFRLAMARQIGDQHSMAVAQRFDSGVSRRDDWNRVRAPVPPWSPPTARHSPSRRHSNVRDPHTDARAASPGCPRVSGLTSWSGVSPLADTGRVSRCLTGA